MLRSLYQPLNVWQSWAPHAIIVATICHRLKDENVSPVTDTLNFVSHLYSLSPGGKQFSYFGMSQKPIHIVALSLPLVAGPALIFKVEENGEMG